MLAIAPGQTRAAVYLTLSNTGKQSRSINLISSSISGYAEVHNHLHEDGVMKMRKVEHPSIAANSDLEFHPGGYHIMLFDVAESPIVGSHFELLFEFDRAESLKVMVEVRPVH